MKDGGAMLSGPFRPGKRMLGVPGVDLVGAKNI